MAECQHREDMNMETITVTIGRNVGDQPMSAQRWNDYTRATRTAVTAVAEPWIDGVSYVGEWDDIPEDARVWFGPLTGDVERLRAQLTALAHDYGQDAIGLSVGTGELVEAGTAPVPVDAGAEL